MDSTLYEEHAALEEVHWWFVARRAIIAAVLDRYVGQTTDERVVLDAGCGTGGMLPLLSDYGTVSGIEGEPDAVANCHERYPTFPVRVGSVPDGLRGDGPFDVVTAFDVIEHIDDDAAALRSLVGAVKDDGTLVVTVPALGWLWSDHDTLNGHFRRYDRRGLAAVLEGAGLEVVHVSYFNTVLFPLVAGARLLQRLRPRRAQSEMSSDFTLPGPSLNRFLTKVMSLERTLAARRGLPIGVSLIAVARPRVPW